MFLLSESEMDVMAPVLSGLEASLNRRRSAAINNIKIDDKPKLLQSFVERESMSDGNTTLGLDFVVPETIYME